MGRGQLYYSGQVLHDVLHLPDELSIRDIEYKPETDSWVVYVFGDSAPDVPECCESPMGTLEVQLNGNAKRITVSWPD